MCRNQKFSFIEVAIMTSLTRKAAEVWLGKQSSFAVNVMKLFSTWKTLLSYIFIPVRKDNLGDYQHCGFPQVQPS